MSPPPEHAPDSARAARPSRAWRLGETVALCLLLLFPLGAVGLLAQAQRAEFGSWRAVGAQYAGVLVGLAVAQAGWAWAARRVGSGPGGSKPGWVWLMFVPAAAAGGAVGALTRAAVAGTGQPRGAAVVGALWGVSVAAALWAFGALAARARGSRQRGAI